MEYIWKRSRRKTIGIYITKDAQVEVRLPLRCPRKEAERFIEEKQPWIDSNLARARERLEKKRTFRLKEGSAILVEGNWCRLKFGANARFDEKTLTLPATTETVKTELINWYRRRAKERLTERLSHYEAISGWNAQGVRITAAKTRWGSCSGKNRLCFSWRLILAPPEALDYVVVHELAHTVEHNHSPRFWRLVASVLPDYKQRQQLLRQTEQILAGQDWE